MDDKVYTNETIPDVAFPGQSSQTVTDTSQAGTATTPGKNATIPQQNLPQIIQAQELLSTALNTRTKKIIQEFQFTPSGALQIGNLEIGVNGDIRISPEGIVARNNLGDETIAIDGETGDAVFSGKIRSGSEVTGKIIVGNGNVVIDGTNDGTLTIQNNEGITILDALGLVSTTTFSNENTINGAVHQAVTGGLIDINTSEYNFTLKRKSVVLFLFKVDIGLDEDSGTVSSAEIDLNIDGINQSQIRIDHAFKFLNTQSSFYLSVLDKGVHTIKLQAGITITGGSPVLNVIGFTSSYIILGS